MSLSSLRVPSFCITFPGFVSLTDVVGNLDSVEIRGVEFEMNASVSDNLQASFGFSIPDGKENEELLVSIDSEEAILGLVWTSGDNRFNLSGYASFTAGSHDNLAPSCGRGGCNPLLTLSVNADVFTMRGEPSSVHIFL